MEINKIYCGNSIDILKQFDENQIDCCITSPPYYGLRDYGCDGQIGLEKEPSEYINTLVDVFMQVYRVLKPEGTLWLNIGDSYAGSKKGAAHYAENAQKYKQSSNKGSFDRPNILSNYTDSVIKPKDMIGIPWMLAFALRERGWFLRNDIIWAKPNPMPESVLDRCTKSHEYIFLLSKSRNYYYDADSIKENTVYPVGSRTEKKRGDFGGKFHAHEDFKHISDSFRAIRNYRNKRDVWNIPTKPYKGAHFATFPPELIIPCVKAGCPKNGIVLDPFIGSGTTGCVCKELRRNYIGIDINQDYCEMAEKRIQNYGNQLSIDDFPEVLP